MADGFILLSSQKSTESTPLENRKIIPDADIDRVAYAYAAKLFPQGVPVPEVKDADGNVTTPASVRAPTGQEVFTALTENIYVDIKREVEAYFLAQAEAQARASVTPITLNPAA